MTRSSTSSPGKMRRGRNARPGCAEKANDEGGHETLDHQARMQNGGILDNTRVVERPERDPKHGEERTDREKKTERLLVKQVRGSQSILHSLRKAVPRGRIAYALVCTLWL